MLGRIAASARATTAKARTTPVRRSTVLGGIAAVRRWTKTITILWRVVAGMKAATTSGTEVGITTVRRWAKPTVLLWVVAAGAMLIVLSRLLRAHTREHWRMSPVARIARVNIPLRRELVLLILRWRLCMRLLIGVELLLLRMWRRRMLIVLSRLLRPHTRGHWRMSPVARIARVNIPLRCELVLLSLRWRWHIRLLIEFVLLLLWLIRMTLMMLLRRHMF